MASYLYGIDSGLVVDISMGVLTASGDLSDITETIRPSNIIIGLSGDQFDLLFDVSSVSGALVLDASALQNLFVNILNYENIGATWTYLSGHLTIGGTTMEDICNADLHEITTDTSSHIYNLVDYIQYCRYYLNPSQDLDSVKKQFILNSLGMAGEDSDPSFLELSGTLVTAYNNLGFFEGLAGKLGDVSDVLGKDEDGTGDRPAVSGDIVIDTTNFDGEGLFAAIADAGFITFDGISDTDLSLEDGFAISVQLKLSGITNITVRYPTDASFFDPSAGPTGSYIGDISSDLSGILEGQTLLTNSLKLSDPEVTRYLATGTMLTTDDGEGSQTINVLLFKYSQETSLP